ncbi:MAG: lipoprotein [Bradyrhizobiaceae bacterium]|nr:lipoprotein [Bradyrhizobiaceae bacterium]
MRRRNKYIPAACWGPPVTEKYRVGTAHFVVLAFAAGALAACGVKGDLERPPAASYNEPVAGQKTAGASTGKVFTEESRVQRVPAYSILPKMPPEEWEKMKGTDAQAKQAPKKSPGADTRDRPFILDGLL